MDAVGSGTTMEPAFRLALEASFGSVERWRDEFVAIGTGRGGGSGRLLLMFQPREGTLVNLRACGPTQGDADGVPLLALDMKEHADRGLGAEAAADVDAFMARIDWTAVYARYQQAVHGATETLGAGADEVGAAAVVVDVRRAGVFEQATTMLPDAHWRDPAAVGRWASELPREGEVVVYCVYGHEVGRSTALRLRAAGLNARYLRGGIDGWQAAGHPVVARTAQGGGA